MRALQVELLPALVLAAAILCGCAAPERDAPPAPTLVAMTFNLRYANPSDPFPWPQRLPAVLAVVRAAAPDLLGTQEGLAGQIDDLARELPEYDWVGRGRDEGGRGELAALFYRRERFALVDTGNFWLSDTPEIEASTTWGNATRRMLTWARLRERASGRSLLVMNTHFDHAVEGARERSAQLVLERSWQLAGRDPVVLLGDFNAPAGSTPWRTLVAEGGFVDAWEQAQQKGPDLGTFQGWEQPDPGGARIDWILLRGMGAVRAARVHPERPGGVWPSDHLAVSATLAY